MHAIDDEFRRGSRFRAAIRVLPREPATSDAAAVIADRELLERGFARLSIEHRSVVVLRLHLGLSIAATIFGYHGKYLELTTPADLDPAACSKAPGASPTSPGFFVTWVGPALTDDYMGFAGPGSRDRVWILDVDGVRLVLAASVFRDATAADRAELRSIIDSIQIEPVPPAQSASPTAGP